MEKIFKFKSVGVKHSDENDFFKFLVQQEFSISGNRAIQWCTFNNLEIKVTCISAEIIEFCEPIFKKGIITNNGHNYILSN